jgi:hypothetical protein
LALAVVDHDGGSERLGRRVRWGGSSATFHRWRGEEGVDGGEMLPRPWRQWITAGDLSAWVGGHDGVDDGDRGAEGEDVSGVDGR